MSQPVKFTFERRFSDRRQNPFSYGGEEEQKVAREQHEQALKGAEASGFQAGFEQGLQQARAEETARLSRAIELLGNHLAVLRVDLGDIVEAASGEAIRFAHIFATKLSGDIARRLPLASVEQALLTIMSDVRGAPHLALSVAPDLVEAATERCSELAKRHGFEGRLVVLGDPSSMPGDAKIEWAEGGIVISREETERKIAELTGALTANLAGGGGIFD